VHQQHEVSNNFEPPQRHSQDSSDICIIEEKEFRSAAEPPPRQNDHSRNSLDEKINYTRNNFSNNDKLKDK
jgi:hypothetical protein